MAINPIPRMAKKRLRDLIDESSERMDAALSRRDIPTAAAYHKRLQTLERIEKARATWNGGE